MNTKPHIAGVSLRSPAVMAAGVHLYLHSALRYCTEMPAVDEADDIRLEAVRHPSMFSSGEKVLWHALGCLAISDSDDEIDFYDAALDSSNRTALAEAVEMWRAAR